MAINKAKQRFLEWQRNNQIVSQLNQLHQQGFSADQIRAAGPGAFQSLSQVPIKDGQTLDQIAANNNSTVPDILKANPDMTAPKTGMVINVPGSEGWRIQNAYGGGQPSNAALGGTTTNPQGANMWAGTTPGYNSLQTNQTNNFSPTAGLQPPASNPFASYAHKTPLFPVPAWNPNAFATPAEAIAKGQVPSTPGQPQTPQQTAQPKPYQYDATAYFKPLANMQNGLKNILLKVDQGYTPNADEMQWLNVAGLIEQTPTYGGGGGYGGYKNYYRRGRGGGGGGGYSKQPKVPAFSSGAGFGGLVNWRI
jgi:LysM repeat protein